MRPLTMLAIAGTVLALATFIFLRQPQSAFTPRTVHFAYAVLHAKGPLQRLLPNAAPVRSFEKPNEALINYQGNHIEESDKPKLRALPERSILEFTAPAGRAALPVVLQAQADILQLARELDGYILDEDTGQIFSQQEFQKRRVEAPPGVLSQVMIKWEARPGGLLRLSTEGLSHLGLPELAVKQVPASLRRSMASVLNLAGQTAFERGALTPELRVSVEELKDARLREELLPQQVPGASSEATLDLRPAAGGEIELTFVDAQIGQHALVSQLFGSPDRTSRIQHDDAIQEASRKAREQLLTVLKPQFRKGQLAHLEVKGPFGPGPHREWMWVDLTGWDGDTVQGVLDSDPEIVKDLKAGSQVTLRDDELFDYLLWLPDGGTEGNTTGELMRQQEAAKPAIPR